MPFPEFKDYNSMLKELTTIAKNEQFGTNLGSEEFD